MGLFKKKKLDIIGILCKESGMSHHQLYQFVNQGKKNYNTFKIRKQHRYRKVYQPIEQLRDLQDTVLKRVILSYPVSKSATAYEPGCSTLNNAIKHKKGSYLIHFDISLFFESINFTLFKNLLKKDYSDYQIEFLWKVCSLHDSLPIGAPTSPFIANRVMYHFDKKMTKIFGKIAYTRYADDLVFSSKKSLPSNIEETVRNELYQYRFYLNNKKTYNFSDKSHKKVTGIVINLDGSFSVGKRYKKKVKKLLYQYKTDRGLYPSIKGHLNYIKMIEPGYFKYLVRKYLPYF